jgi:hypothetical protein
MTRLELHILIRHAVKAPDIAAIRDADTQTIVPPLEGVDQWLDGIHGFFEGKTCGRKDDSPTWRR